MEKPLKTIVITRPDFFVGETELVNYLFETGVIERLHLRKPKATEEEMTQWIEQIADPFHHRIVLHDYHQLAIKYELGGVHLNSRNPYPPENLITSRPHNLKTISRSCHSIDEIRKYKDECDYLFLSPIFDSISKEGYGAAFDREEIEYARKEGLLSDNVFALGGISPNNMHIIQDMGFAGAAVLGSFWQQYS